VPFAIKLRERWKRRAASLGSLKSFIRGQQRGVSYFISGVQASFNEHGAMDLLAKECPKGFK
jgi:hypothetical protein